MNIIIITKMENENYEKRLNDLISEIRILILESRETNLLSKKFENYGKGNLLISEANHTLEMLQKIVRNIEVHENSKISMNDVDELITILSVPDLKISEIVNVISRLKSFQSSLPDRAHITDNIQDEVVRIDRSEDF